MECINHLKQIGLAAQNHVNEQRIFPSGGWGYYWIGDADLGFGLKQPGGFWYNILPFMEYKSVHDMSRNTRKNPSVATLQMCAVAMGEFNCPSRRVAPVLPAVEVFANTLHPANAPPFKAGEVGDKTSDVIFHGDYKANAGSNGPPAAWWGGGPANWDQATSTATPFNWTGPRMCNGISYQHSLVKIKDVVDGTSHTILAGEKYQNPDNYYSGVDYSDDQTLLGGDDYDLYVWGDMQPWRDRKGLDPAYESPFGSAHPFTFNVVFCDGSTKSESYDIAYTKTGKVNLALLQSLCCINDRKAGLIGKFKPSDYPAIDSSGY